MFDVYALFTLLVLMNAFPMFNVICPCLSIANIDNIYLFITFTLFPLFCSVLFCSRFWFCFDFVLILFWFCFDFVLILSWGVLSCPELSWAGLSWSDLFWLFFVVIVLASCIFLYFKIILYSVMRFTYFVYTLLWLNPSNWFIFLSHDAFIQLV
jgi:hypothetical protein